MGQAEDVSLSELQGRIQSALIDSPFYGLRHLTVFAQNKEILISGSVSSFYQKQLAQELVRSLAGAVPIVNQILVRSELDNE